MIQFNQLAIAGRLVDDPGVRSLQDGTKVANFRLAFDTGFGEKKRANFVDVKVFRKSADFVAQYLTKGAGVMIEGRIEQEQWDDKETGAKRSKVVIVADRIQFAESKYEQEADLPW